MCGMLKCQLKVGLNDYKIMRDNFLPYWHRYRDVLVCIIPYSIAARPIRERVSGSFGLGHCGAARWDLSPSAIPYKSFGKPYMTVGTPAD